MPQGKKKRTPSGRDKSDPRHFNFLPPAAQNRECALEIRTPPQKAKSRAWGGGAGAAVEVELDFASAQPCLVMGVRAWLGGPCITKKNEEPAALWG